MIYMGHILTKWRPCNVEIKVAFLSALLWAKKCTFMLQVSWKYQMIWATLILYKPEGRSKLPNLCVFTLIMMVRKEKQLKVYMSSYFSKMYTYFLNEIPSIFLDKSKYFKCLDINSNYIFDKVVGNPKMKYSVLWSSKHNQHWLFSFTCWYRILYTRFLTYLG